MGVGVFNSLTTDCDLHYCESVEKTEAPRYIILELKSRHRSSGRSLLDTAIVVDRIQQTHLVMTWTLERGLIV